MKPAFADTAYFLAFLNPDDDDHEIALLLGETLEEPLITTEWILTELGNALSATRFRRKFEETVRRLRRDPNVEIVAAPDLFDKACQLYFSREDKEWSLTDCASFIVMAERGLTAALTTDHHFKQAGFDVLMRV